MSTDTILHRVVSPQPNKRQAGFLVMLLSLIVMAGFATEASSSSTIIPRHDPQILLKQATDELLALSQAAAKQPTVDRQAYYSQVSNILDQIIDKDYFARGVMATYASVRLYRTLETEEQKQHFKHRIDVFADNLQSVLIEKYADTLLAFKGERIDTESLTGGKIDAGKTSLLQIIFDEGNTTYRVQYNLSQQKDGNWLITNVIVEGVNLGATYRNQFAEAVEKNQGNVDYVVTHWAALMQQKKSTGDAQ